MRGRGHWGVARVVSGALAEAPTPQIECRVWGSVRRPSVAFLPGFPGSRISLGTLLPLRTDDGWTVSGSLGAGQPRTEASGEAEPLTKGRRDNCGRCFGGAGLSDGLVAPLSS